MDPTDLAASYEEVKATLASGVAVLTGVDADGERRGMTVSSLTPVAGDTPAVLVCVGADASMRAMMAPGRRFNANILGESQSALSNGFAFGDEDPFDVFPWESDESGTPVLSGVAGHLQCVVENVVDRRGTAVVLAAVTGASLDHADTLIYWQQAYYGHLRKL
jgi:flavin reductase (DIM6/NTAB) family NADH-FMN oxidoreductase RutF